MKKQKIKVTQLLVLLSLFFALVAGDVILPGAAAEAATKKTAISATEMTIPVGKMDSKVYWVKDSYGIDSGKKLSVQNPVKGATYQFTSSNTKVATIGKSGGYLTGVKAGSATITLTQTLKSKKTTIGKCKVTVKKASLSVNEYDNEFAIESGKYDLAYYYNGYEPLYGIAYRNPGATYSVTSSSDNFTIKEIKYDASKVKEMTDQKEYQSMLKEYIGSGYFYGYQYTAKKAGIYTITVKETYNKKTTTLGSFKVEVKDPAIAEPKQNILIGSSVYALSLVNYTKADTNYYFEIKDYDEVNQDNNVLRFIQNDSTLLLYANKIGTVDVTVKEGSEQGPVIGTVTFVVAEAPCEGITVEPEFSTYVGDDYFSVYYDLEPWDTTDKVTIESDNSEVLKVEYDQESESWVYTPLKVGEANVTIKAGNQSATTKVIVEEW